MKYITHVPAVRDVKIWVAFFLLLVGIPALIGYYFQSDNPFVLIGLVLIIGFFIFNLVIRRSLDFKNYFTSRFNILTSKTSSELRFDLAADLMFDKMLEVIDASPFKLSDMKRETFEILTVSRISFQSWGENIYIRFEPDGDQTTMKFCSVTLFQVYDWGKNQKNRIRLFEAIEDSFTV